MNPIKLWFSYEKNLKKLEKAFKKNMVQDKKTGVWRNKEMAKKELKEQLKSYERYINDIPLVIDPCKQCKKQKRKSEIVLGYSEECHECCWFYDSKFEVEVDDNSCATCRHKAKMLTDKNPCVDCDNGCNWEK